MTRRQWRDLSPRARRLIVGGAALDGALRVAALADLRSRPASQVRGPKWRWAVVLVLVNSGGVAPLVYFRKGRHS